MELILVRPINIIWSATSCAQSLNCIQLFATTWTVSRQAPLSMGFPRQKYWSGLPFPPPGYLPNPKMEPVSPAGRQSLYYWATREAPYRNVWWLHTVMYVALYH